MSVALTERSDVELKDTKSPLAGFRASGLWWIVPVLVAIFVFLQFDPRLLFSNTTTAGGDTGAHYMVPYYVEHHVLNHFRITGWSPQWYDGYPILTFYFPLPSLLVALINVVVPYGIAFKVVTALGSIFFPIGTYVLFRAAKLPKELAALASVFSLGYLLNTSYTIDGGNIASTLAGEFSFSLSLTIGLFFLALVLRGLKGPKRIALGALLYGLCAMAHILPAIFVAVVALVYVLLQFSLRKVLALAATGALGLAFIAFWIVPFGYFLPYSTSMGWQKVTGYLSNLAPSSLRPWLLLALIGALYSLYKREKFGISLFITGAISALTFAFMPPSAIYNARALPFWTFCIYTLAAVGVWGAIRSGFDIYNLLVRSTNARKSADHAPDVEQGDASEELANLGLLSLEGAPEVEPGSGPLDGDPRGSSPDSLDDLCAHSKPNSDGGGPLISEDDRFIDPDQYPEIDSVPIEEAPTSGPAQAVFLGVVGVIAGLILLVGILFPYFGSPPWLGFIKSARSFVPSWVSWNYSGYEGKAAWPEYRSIILKMRSVAQSYGCGRAMWEYNSSENDFGTPMALMLLPYWTNNCINTQEGLFFESSATTPYHFLDQSELSAAPSEAMSGLPYAGLNVNLGIAHLQMMGVRYFMAFSPSVVAAANRNSNLELIDQVPAVNPKSQTVSNTETWNIYLVKGSALVAPLQNLPAVITPNSNGRVQWLNSAVQWYMNPSEWSVLRAASGPSNWPRVSPKAKVAPIKHLPADAVSSIVAGNSNLSFNVTTPGVPVYVKISYFPDWKAKGAYGPYRVTPNLMVVVPTQKHVELNYGVSPIEKLSDGISIAAIVAIALMGTTYGARILGKLRRGGSVATSKTDADQLLG